MITKIKHFEIVGDMEEFKSELAKKKYSGLIRNYILCKLGRELKREETESKSCIKIYFDGDGNLLTAEIFNPVGRMIDKIDFDMPCNQNEETTIKSENEPYIEEKCIVTLFDVDSAFKHGLTPGGNLTVKISNAVLMFKKIDPSPFDIYIFEPYDFLSFCYTFDNPDRMLYNYGYKLIKQTSFDIDGVVDFGWHSEFDNRGLLVREDHYSGTPWGGVLVNTVSEWTYELDKMAVTMKNIHVDESRIGSVNKYEIGEKGRIKKHYDYLYLNKKNTGLLDVKYSPENLMLEREYDYTYNDRGQIIKVITNNHFPPPPYTCDIYEYDTLGRLVDAKSYGEHGELETQIIYEYLDSLRVWMITRDYPNSWIYRYSHGLM